MPNSPFSPSGGSPKVDDANSRPSLAILQGDSGAGGRKAKRTYGRSRTFLEETNGAEAGLAALADHDTEEKQSYAEMRRKYEVDNAVAGGSSPGLLAVCGLRGASEKVALITRSCSKLVPHSLSPTCGRKARTGDSLTRSDTSSLGCRTLWRHCHCDGRGELILGCHLIQADMSSLDVLRSLQDEQWAQKVHVCDQSEALWEGLMSARKDGDDVSRASAPSQFN